MLRTVLNCSEKFLYRKFRHFLRRPEHPRIIGEKYFFIDELLPEKLIESKCNVDRFVKLRVEALSPFALNEVMYGFFKNESKLAIFIAYKRRLEPFLPERHSYIFPEFLPRLIVGYDFAIKNVRMDRNGDIIFSSASETFKLRGTDPIAFNVDLRDWKIKKRAKFLRNFSKFLNYGTCICSIMLMLICVCFGCVFFESLHLDGLKKQIEVRKLEVDDVVSKNGFLENISKFYSGENFCLVSLEEINRVRPDDILFADVHCDADGRFLKIRGHAQSASSVAKYYSSLKQRPVVKNVKISNVHSYDRGAFFSMDIHFE
jgi:hypothetical protein